MIAAAGVTLSHGLTVSSLVGARSEVVRVSGLNHWYREVRGPLPEGATLRSGHGVSYTLGAPDAWATAWVRDDGKKLYAEPWQARPTLGSSRSARTGASSSRPPASSPDRSRPPAPRARRS